MASPMVVLKAQPRKVLGKRVKRLRRQGLTPLHLYGPGIPSQPLQADAASLRRLLTQVGKSRPVSVQVEGDPTPHIAFVREVQFHPLTEEVLHVDLYRVDVAERLEVEVPLALVGEAPALRQGGSLFQVLHAVRVECLPLEVPEAIPVDLSALKDFESVIRVGDLAFPPGVTPLTEPEQVVVQVTPPEGVEAAPEGAPPEPGAAVGETS